MYPSYKLPRHSLHRLFPQVLYYILTKRWIFERRTQKKAVEFVLQGKRSEIPDAILNSTNPADLAMMKGIEMAWTQDPGKRPSARQIADFFYKELLGLNGNKPNDYRISVPPLPPNYDFSTKDWYSNYKRDNKK